MKAALLFSSRHGRTRKVVDSAMRQLSLSPDVFDVGAGSVHEKLRDYELLLFFAPTYGDEELEQDMEAFLAGLTQDLSGKRFVICELGNYYGYEDFSFGAMRILRRRLLELNGRELCAPLSLDSFPRLDWSQFDRWVASVNRSLNGDARH
jgi:flavodoxin